jgi:hypothetical protein
MRWSLLVLLALTAMAPALGAAEQARVRKVLPQLLDLKGRHALSPSLYERDAYQARLLKHRAERGGLRFAVQWSAKSRPTVALKLRIEARGVQPGKPAASHIFEQPLEWANSRSDWAEVAIRGEAYAKLGDLTAWRVTLWDGDQQLAEAKSFLW